MAIKDGRSDDYPQYGGVNPYCLPLRSALVVSALTVAGAALGWAASLTVPDYYVATTRIRPSLSGTQIAPDAPDTAHIASQQYIMTSARVLARAVENGRLQDDPEFAAIAAQGGTGQVIEALRKAISVTATDGGNVLELTARASRAGTAAGVANLVATAYLDISHEMDAALPQGGDATLTARLEQARQELLYAEQALDDYRTSRLPPSAPPRQQPAANAADTARIREEIDRNEAMIADLERARSDRQYLRSLSGAQLGETIATLRARYNESQEQEAVLAASLGERHPSLQAARTRMQSLARMLDEQLASLAGTLARNTERLKSSLGRTQDNAALPPAGSSGDTGAPPQQTPRLQELQQRLESSRTAYETLLAERSAPPATAGSGTAETSAQVISVAGPPLQAAGPSRLVPAVAGGALGLLAGTCLMLLRYRRRRIARREDIFPDDEPVIPPAGIPAAPPAQWRDMADSRPVEPPQDATSGPAGSWRFAMRAPDGVPVQPPESEPPAPPVPDRSPGGLMAMLLGRLAASNAEQQDQADSGPADNATTRNERADAMLARPDEGYAGFARMVAAARPPGGNYCVMITVTGPQDRSPQISFNLAAAAARQGRRVLLIDAGNREGGLTSALACDGLPGLAGMIAGAGFDETRLIRFGNFPRLAFVASGAIPRGACTDGLRADSEPGLLDWLEAGDCNFDLIIVDGGLATSPGIAPEVGNDIDTTLIIRHEGDTGRAGAALSALEERGFLRTQIVRMSATGFSTGLGSPEKPPGAGRIKFPKD